MEEKDLQSCTGIKDPGGPLLSKPGLKWMSRGFSTTHVSRVLSIIAGTSSMGSGTEGLWTGYCQYQLKDFNSCQLEVESSQSDKQLRGYGHLNIPLCSQPRVLKCYCLKESALPPTRKIIDNPVLTLFDLT